VVFMSRPLALEVENFGVEMYRSLQIAGLDHGYNLHDTLPGRKANRILPLQHQRATESGEKQDLLLMPASAAEVQTGRTSEIERTSDPNRNQLPLRDHIDGM
jgi:hypothetical protein